ncbi:MAG: D-alanyl-D-alanine carboxypeptidase [Actinobacteria bacterium]|nr:D-alanyl-D-alanine carboxypeptidase [Actinomycetota bacterium]
MSIKRLLLRYASVLIKFLIFLILIPIINFTIVPKYIHAASNDFIDITAEAAIIMEYDSGKILWEKNSNEKLYPASITKIMTGIVAIENVTDLNEIAIISRNAAGKNSSFFSFKKGDKISIMDLLKAALINSNNNATIAIAEYISGNEKDFVKLMNEKAKEIGAFDTFFQNTNGLDTKYPEHKTTARDLAIIARYSMNNELFRKITNTKNDCIFINDKKVDIFNTNILLFFDYIKGIKTGFTENAGYCLVLYSERQGLKLITVVLKSEENKRAEDILNLINWANDNYSNINIVDSNKIYKTIKIKNGNSEVSLDLYPQKDFAQLVNINDKIEITETLNSDIALPITKGQEIGKISVNINNKNAEDIKLISKNSIDKPVIIQNIVTEKNQNPKKVLIFLLPFYFLVFIFIIIKNLFIRG